MRWERGVALSLPAVTYIPRGKGENVATPSRRLNSCITLVGGNNSWVGVEWLDSR